MKRVEYPGRHVMTYLPTGSICHIAIFDTACPGLLRNAVKILAHKNEAEQKFSRPIHADQTKAYIMA